MKLVWPTYEYLPDYRAALARLDARPSMSRKADCWDNSVSESFFATLEKELLALGFSGSGSPAC